MCSQYLKKKKKNLLYRKQTLYLRGLKDRLPTNQASQALVHWLCVTLHLNKTLNPEI